MPQVPRDIIDEIRARTNIVEVVSRYVQLTRSGTSLKGLCPFHKEKSPSFNVNEARNMWYCFGCSEGGDVFDFLIKQENRGFMEVVEELGEACGVSIPKAPLTPQQQQARSEADEMFDANERAGEFFKQSLRAAAGKDALEYLQKRGIGDDVAEEFGIGYCGPGWDACARYFKTNRLSIPLGEKAGLFSPRRKGEGHYDRFHERLVFPVRNYRGRAIGFGGRKLNGETTAGDQSPKYLNSSESPVYKKSEALYGIDTARAAIGKTERVIVVEGYFDLLGLAAHGIREVVATCGTALTPQHLDVIRRYNPRQVILLYDGDDAGRKAAVRVLPLFLQAGIPGRYAGLPQGEDPDTWVAKIGGDAFRSFLDKSAPLAEYYITEVLQPKAKDLSAAERAALLKQVAPIFRNVKDPVELTEYVSRLAEALKLQPSSISSALAPEAAPGGSQERPKSQEWQGNSGGGKRPWVPASEWKGRHQKQAPAGGDIPISKKLETVSAGERNFEETILRLMLGSHRIADSVRAHKIVRLFKDPILKSLGERIAEAFSRTPPRTHDADQADQPDVAAVAKSAEFSDEERRLIQQLAINAVPGDVSAALKTYEECRRILEQRALSERLKALVHEIKAAERGDDTSRLMALLSEQRDLERQLVK